MNEEEKIELKKCQEQIRKDFDRFLELERSYIINCSHVVMPLAGGVIHEDRKEFRKKLFKHLREIIRK